MRLCSLPAAFLLLVLPAATRADTLITFRAPNYDPLTSTPPYSSGLNHMSGSFVTTTKLLAGMLFGPVTVTSFTFSDGVYLTFDPSNSVGSFELSTDSKDEITNFIFDAQTIACSPVPYAPEICGPDAEINFGSYPFRRNPGDPFLANDFVSSLQGYGSDEDLPGIVLSETNIRPTPEPSTIALLSTGLLGVAGVVRKRYAR